MRHQANALFKTDLDALVSACNRLHKISLDTWALAYIIGYARDFIGTRGKVGGFGGYNSGLEKHVRGAALEVVVRDYLEDCGHVGLVEQYDQTCFSEDHRNIETFPDFMTEGERNEDFWFDLKSARCVAFHKKVLATIGKMPRSDGAFAVGFLEIGSPITFISKPVACGPMRQNQVNRCLGGWIWEDNNRFKGSHVIDRKEFIAEYTGFRAEALERIGNVKYEIDEIKKTAHNTSISDIAWKRFKIGREFWQQAKDVF